MESVEQGQESLLQKLWKRLINGSTPSTLPSGERPRPVVWPQDVTDADFAERVLASDRPAVVDFWAEWCAPCEVMSAHVALLAQAYGDRLLVAALDVDENPNTAEQYQVMGLPALLFFRDGVEVDRQVGLLPYEALRQKVDALLAG